MGVFGELRIFHHGLKPLHRSLRAFSTHERLNREWTRMDAKSWNFQDKSLLDSRALAFIRGCPFCKIIRSHSSLACLKFRITPT